MRAWERSLPYNYWPGFESRKRRHVEFVAQWNPAWQKGYTQSLVKKNFFWPIGDRINGVPLYLLSSFSPSFLGQNGQTACLIQNFPFSLSVPAQIARAWRCEGIIKYCRVTGKSETLLITKLLCSYKVEDHVKNTCPLTEVPCPYDWIGCTWKVIFLINRVFKIFRCWMLEWTLIA